MSEASTQDGSTGARSERRKNPRLRALIDEMLATIRVHVNQDLWTEDERRTAEHDLERIMRRVRETTYSASPGRDPAA
jgi:hypothetical protein